MTALDQAGRDPLHYAAKNNDTDGVRERLAAGVDVNLTETRSRYTPLHFAVQDGAVNAARMLLDAGADVRAVCTPGVAPLHLAVIRWRQSTEGAMIKLLLERGGTRPPSRRTDALRPKSPRDSSGFPTSSRRCCSHDRSRRRRAPTPAPSALVRPTAGCRS
jgi:ankyrin repeat protein